MERQQAFTILGAAGASAAVTATLLFLWNPAPPSGPPAEAEGVAALRREVALLRGELAARPEPLPPPVVAERVIDIEGGRARDELQRRCDDLTARCEELERTVAELHERVAGDATDRMNGFYLFPVAGGERRGGFVQTFQSLGDGRFATRADALNQWTSAAFLSLPKAINTNQSDEGAQPTDAPTDQ